MLPHESAAHEQETVWRQAENGAAEQQVPANPVVCRSAMPKRTFIKRPAWMAAPDTNGHSQ
jgi:hypothetical protein